MFPRRRWTLALPLLLALVAGPLLSRTAELPAKLHDAEFWQLLSGFSEPNGRFPYENFVSNEYALQSVIPSLLSTAPPGGVYLGVGPEQNFTYIAALRPRIAFILDIRRQNLVEHLLYKAIFELSRKRADFVALLFSRKQPANLSSRSTAEELFKAYLAVHGDPQSFDENLERIIKRLTVDHQFPLSEEDRSGIRYAYTTFFRNGPALDYTIGGFFSFDDPPSYVDLMTADDGRGVMRSFLASEENFQVVKKLEGANLLIPVVGDFAGPKALREIGRYLADHHATVTAFYLSNVERYLFDAPGSWRKFYVNMAIVPYDSRSVFIRSVFDASYGSASSVSTIEEVMTAFSEARIRTYADITALANAH